MAQKQWIYYLITVLVILLVGCAQREDDRARVNPFDPGGNNWVNNSNPELSVSIDSLWSDFDFDDSTGTILGNVSVYDKNGQHDTVTVEAFFGTSGSDMDSLAMNQDSSISFTGLALSTRYFHKVVATDTWDSVDVDSGYFTTPAGYPPLPVDSIYISIMSSYIPITWHGVQSNILYKVFRAPAINGPYKLIYDTLSGSSNSYITYNDNVNDYRTYYYKIGAANQYGVCRSKKIASGYIYSSSVSAPYNVYAYGGNDIYIRVTWSSVSYAQKYYIHRGKSVSGPFVIAGSSTTTSFYDTITDIDPTNINSRYYYRISAEDSQGRRSKMSSDYDYASLSQLNSPYSVSASDGTYASHIAITWSSVTNAYGYYVYRSLTYSGTYDFIDSTKTTSYNDSVKTADNYYYKIAAYNKYGRPGSLSSYNSGYITRLNAPVSVSASSGTYEEYIAVSWSVVTGASGYNIYRSKGANILDSFKLVDSTTTLSYNDSVTTPDNYYYYIVAYDSTGRYSPKSTITYGYLLRLSTPSISSISRGTYYNYILIRWYTVTGADGYYLYRSGNGSGGPFELIDSTDTATYKDSSITGTSYFYYKIAAYTLSGKISQQSSSGYGYLKAFSYPDSIAASQYEYKNKITLSWDTVPGATGYNVYRSTSSSGVYDKVTTVTTNSYEDVALGSEPRYYYKISSLKGPQETSRSGYVIGYSLVPPSSFTTQGYTGYIYLRWGSLNSSSIKGYYLYRSSDSTSFMRIAVLNSYSTSVYRDSIADYSKYYYKISAFSLSEESDYSPILSCQKLPYTPTNLTSQSYNTYVALTWDSTGGTEYYRVYRGTSSSYPPLFDSTTRPYYNDSSLTTSTKYYYSISAVNKGGESGKSNYVYAGIIIRPSAPYNLTGSNTTAHIYLNWSQNSSDDVDGFVIYRSSDTGATYSPLDTSLSNKNYYDYVVDGRLYYYRISAYNTVGESDRSTPVSARRLTPETPASIYIGSEQFKTHIPVSWSSSTGATGYNVYRSLSADSSYLKLATILTTVHNDSTVLANTIYYYKISAYSTVGESQLSDYVSGKKLSIE